MSLNRPQPFFLQFFPVTGEILAEHRIPLTLGVGSGWTQVPLVLFTLWRVLGWGGAIPNPTVVPGLGVVGRRCLANYFNDFGIHIISRKLYLPAGASSLYPASLHPLL